MLTTQSISLDRIREAQVTLKKIVLKSPLTKNDNASLNYNSSIFFKREDLQIVRSYKIRGAYNKINSLTKKELNKGVICASAGNHAQGVAYSCNKLKVKGVIFMPMTTSEQKINQVKMFGKKWVEIKLFGDVFDDSYKAALVYKKKNNLTFIHPFDDKRVIEGQGTIGIEILNEASFKIDYLIVPVGGGGLASGVSSVFKVLSPNTKIIGVEPEGAASLSTSLKNGYNTTLSDIDKFVDGAAVKRIGDITFPICQKNLNDVIIVHEGKICSTILELYNKDAIVVEPAGALAIAALDQLKGKIKGKNVVCIISGGNNDISRMQEIKERSLLYKQLKHYFIVDFPQRAGALKDFVVNVLGPTDDIVHFAFSKKTNMESGPAVVGIELKKKEDLKSLTHRMKLNHFSSEYLNNKPSLFKYLI